jgi:hypothetical protein
MPWVIATQGNQVKASRQPSTFNLLDNNLVLDNNEAI